jgi:hypothetical protein
LFREVEQKSSLSESGKSNLFAAIAAQGRRCDEINRGEAEVTYRSSHNDDRRLIGRRMNVSGAKAAVIDIGNSKAVSLHWE